MSVDRGHLGALVTAIYAQGGIYAIGRMETFIEAPSVVIVLDSGEKVSWRADLCREPTDSDLARYWKERAELAERRLGELERKESST